MYVKRYDAAQSSAPHGSTLSWPLTETSSSRHSLGQGGQLGHTCASVLLISLESPEICHLPHPPAPPSINFCLWRLSYVTGEAPIMAFAPCHMGALPSSPRLVTQACPSHANEGEESHLCCHRCQPVRKSV